MKPGHRKPPAAQVKAEDAVRLNRYLSMCGLASRRKADEMITSGLVTVNGTIMTTLGTTVRPGRDRVFVNGKEVAHVDAPIYLVLNKPKDTITTSHDERGRPTVMELIHARKRVYPVGRLDRDTTGVLLFTNDGTFANAMMHPRTGIPKAYLVTCDKPVEREHLAQLRTGIRLDKKMTAPAEVFAVPGGRGKEVGITIREGWNRQVRRMFESLGYDVRKLDRVAYGPVTKEGLPRGSTRALTHQEIRKLKQLAGIEKD
ncbi:MAG: rRNA pseudouridine synthase [Bacteroidetes bacterium]|nr:rRNA pseudouridine synthase [Bacteroidota bacterium]